MKKSVTIGFVAPSFVIPKIEFEIGLDRLKQKGFNLNVHTQCYKKYLYLAGTDEDRANAFLEYAFDPKIDVIWCARGGYGAARMLDKALKMTKKRPPRKTLVGFSDITALYDYVAKEWKWKVIHGEMPSQKKFTTQSSSDFEFLCSLVDGEEKKKQSPYPKLKQLNSIKFKKIRSSIVGGNLSVWCANVGTPLFYSPKNRILFLEEVSESPYRIDRMMNQAYRAGALNGLKAILLGEFLSCEDSVKSVLAAKPKSKKEQKKFFNDPSKNDLKPLRPVIGKNKFLKEFFGSLGDELGVPVFSGLPCGHGPRGLALPLYRTVELSRNGNLTLVE